MAQVKEEDLTKQQIIDELDKLRQRNIELEAILKSKERFSAVSDLSLPSQWFSTGSAELYISSRTGAQTDDDVIKYKFSDLVDISLIQQLLNSFYIATGIPHAIVDIDYSILSGIGWQDICTQFHRVCPQTELRCKQSDACITAHLQDGAYVGYKCLNGLMDYATPIIVDGEHLATVFIGQVVHQSPDEDFFSRQAQEFGFDEEKYMAALRRVPIIPEEHIEPIMNFYIQLANFLASLAMSRKRQIELAERAFKEQQNQLSLVWETSNDGFWDWNITTGEVSLSPRWRKILEYSHEELELHILELKKLVHPDDITGLMKELTKHFEGRTEKYKFEYRILSKTNIWKWIRASGQIVARDKTGKPSHMVGTFLDITDHKKTEADLIISEEKFAKVFKCNPDLISISTLKDGRYVEVNDAFMETTGYEKHEVIGHTGQELDIWVIPDERDRIIKQAREYGNIHNVETKFRMKEGKIITCDISLEIIEIDSEEHIIVTTRDISERKQMEEALRFSEECFSKAFNTCPIAMCITTLEEGKFLKVNNAYCLTLGYAEEEVIGQTSLDLGIWMDPAERCLVKKRIITKQIVREIEITFCKKTGEPRLGLYSAEGLEIDGELCMISVLMDITELRRLETEMTRLDRLNLVGEMAASIGHEIRNPMTTVRGYLQILQENEVYIKEKDYFNLMIEELDRANSIITDYLSLAKDKMVDKKPGNLNVIISKSLPLMQAKAMSRDQYIILKLSEIPELLLDKKEINQIILNLINNGLEAMDSPGEITISTYLEEGQVVLAIQDQGQGIDRELLDKLGTPFLTTKEQGTGLGLAVCYRVAAQHNAKIDVQTSSTGTTFLIRFPLAGDWREKN